MIDDTCLYHASVPVLRRYVTQSIVITGKIPENEEAALADRLSPDGFTCGEHLWIAQNFALRGVFPVRGLNTPSLAGNFQSKSDLRIHGEAVLNTLEALTPLDFKGAATRKIYHRAGHADLTQSGSDYLLHFILPNMLFHLTTGYAILRRRGFDLGKADFDGLHAYPAGFSFGQDGR